METKLIKALITAQTAIPQDGYTRVKPFSKTPILLKR